MGIVALSRCGTLASPLVLQRLLFLQHGDPSFSDLAKLLLHGFVELGEVALCAAPTEWSRLLLFGASFAAAREEITVGALGA